MRRIHPRRLGNPYLRMEVFHMLDMMDDAQRLFDADRYRTGTLDRAEVYVRLLHPNAWLIDWFA